MTVRKDLEKKLILFLIVSSKCSSYDRRVEMNREFVKRIYGTIVEEGSSTYRELYETTTITEHTVDYWKKAIGLYQTFDDDKKEIFNDILKQTIIDTISSVFGILDGSSTLSGGNFEFDIKINGVDTENELQDTFLVFVEENI